MNSSLQKLKEIIIKENPKLKTNLCSAHMKGETVDCNVCYRPITLEDVLMATKGILLDFWMGADGKYFCFREFKNKENLGCVWILGKPLDKQSQETIDFLLDLLS